MPEIVGAPYDTSRFETTLCNKASINLKLGHLSEATFSRAMFQGWYNFTQSPNMANSPPSKQFYPDTCESLLSLGGDISAAEWKSSERLR